MIGAIHWGVVNLPVDMALRENVSSTTKTHLSMTLLLGMGGIMSLSPLYAQVTLCPLNVERESHYFMLALTSLLPPLSLLSSWDYKCELLLSCFFSLCVGHTRARDVGLWVHVHPCFWDVAKLDSAHFTGCLGCCRLLCRSSTEHMHTNVHT